MFRAQRGKWTWTWTWTRAVQTTTITSLILRASIHTRYAEQRHDLCDPSHSHNHSHSHSHLRNRSTPSLLSSLFVYSVSSSPVLVALGKSTIALCDTLGLSILYTLPAKATFFKQFCGGENAREVQETMSSLGAHGIGVILNYAKEDSGSSWESFESARDDMMATIDISSTRPNNFIALKMTGLARSSSIASYTEFLRARDATEAYDARLSEDDKEQITDLRERMDEILAHAARKQVRVFIDAEQDRYQAAVEEITLSLQRRHNHAAAEAGAAAVVYGTYQMYRRDALARLINEIDIARREGWTLGAKLVRGAYLESEKRELLQPSKAASDTAYDAALRLTLSSDTGSEGRQVEEREVRIDTMIATHNEKSITYALELLAASPKDSRRGHVGFGQLYGMADSLTYSLSSIAKSLDADGRAGIRVYKYVPWSSVQDAMKYLIRRADENASMMQRGTAERRQIWNELTRRSRAALGLSV